MGAIRNFIDRVFPPEPVSQKKPVTAARGTKTKTSISTYDDKNITFRGEISTYDYDAILREKQKRIIELFELSDYFVDADPIFRGIVKGVYTPFSIANGYRLVGASEQTKQKYEEYYDRIHLKDKMRSIFYQYHKYGNVYIYLMEDGDIITLPVHKVKIANVMSNGEPVVMLNCKGLTDSMGAFGVGSEEKEYINDEELTVKLQGFPPEVAAAIQKGADWVQLNPENTFVLQDIKEDWMRYAVPMVASCLPALSKKNLIAQYDASILNRGISSFLHIKYGDTEGEAYADDATLDELNDLFRGAMTGGAVIATNQFVSAEFVQADTKFLFDNDRYKEVNTDILSAGGISGIIVSGQADDGSTFASAQVSMQTAAIRIRQAQDNFAEMMDKINARANGILPHSKKENLPKFTFPPIDLAGSKSFQEACFKLWSEGVLSNETMLQIHGFDMKQEVERRKTEQADGVEEILTVRDYKQDDILEDKDNPKAKMGRPTLDDTERNSDPSHSDTGRNPKPSRPEGSEPQE